MARRASWFSRFRSAVTGRYESADEAAQHPDQSIRERRRRSEPDPEFRRVIEDAQRRQMEGDEPA
jgi:hypothetical protein